MTKPLHEVLREAADTGDELARIEIDGEQMQMTEDAARRLADVIESEYRPILTDDLDLPWETGDDFVLDNQVHHVEGYDEDGNILYLDGNRELKRIHHTLVCRLPTVEGVRDDIACFCAEGQYHGLIDAKLEKWARQLTYLIERNKL